MSQGLQPRGSRDEPSSPTSPLYTPGQPNRPQPVTYSGYTGAPSPNEMNYSVSTVEYGDTSYRSPGDTSAELTQGRRATVSRVPVGSKTPPLTNLDAPDYLSNAPAHNRIYSTSTAYEPTSPYDGAFSREDVPPNRYSRRPQSLQASNAEYSSTERLNVGAESIQSTRSRRSRYDSESVYF
jgi:hypothetical protein